MVSKKLVLICVAWMIFLAVPLSAAKAASNQSTPPSHTSGWASHMAVQARLISGQSHLGDGEVRVGLHIELEDGWKTYWRTPGDSGLPPRFTWSASENLGLLKVEWPAPTRFDDPGDATLGYKHEVVLPITAKAKDPNRPLNLNLALDYAICADVCVPVHADLSLTIPPGKAAPTLYAKHIDAFAQKVPTRVRDQAGIWLSDPNSTGDLTLHVDWRRELQEEAQLVVEGPRSVILGRPQRHQNSFRVPVKGEDAAALKGQKVTVTLINDVASVEQTSQVK